MRGWDATIPLHIKSACKHAAGDGAAIRDKTVCTTGACGIWHMDTIQRSSAA